MSARWPEQYNRTKRHYNRLVALNSGQRHDISSENYEDDVYNFFINCYHLRDWIVNDKTVPKPVRDEVENYVKCSRYLTICRHICNARKHLRKRSRKCFGQKLFSVGITMGADTTISFVHWEVDTDSGPTDAFQLAEKCVTEWDTFLSAKGLK